MNCRSARTAIALWVGNDLDEQASQRLQRHLATCPRCRDHWLDLKRSLDVLQCVEGTPEGLPLGEVWPSVAARIARRGHQASLQRFNGWLPAVAVAVACLAVVVLTEDASMPPEPIEQVPIADMPLAAPVRIASDAEPLFPSDNQGNFSRNVQMVPHPAEREKKRSAVPIVPVHY